MGTVSQTLQALQQLDLPDRLSDELTQFGQQEALFRLAVIKSARRRSLAERLGGHRISRLMLSPRIADLDLGLQGWTVEPLEQGFFSSIDSTNVAERAERLKDAVVVVNNNDLGSPEQQWGLNALVELAPTSVFVGWDWDNHHWLGRSVALAAQCDLYAPSHPENFYLLTRFNAATVGPVYCGTIQWSRSFLVAHHAGIFNAQRRDDPLGMHLPYGKFEFRNRVISTIGRTFPTVGFSSTQFHAKSPLERLQEWTAHKCHFIVPVLNDIPIRLFDALITGGIAIVPTSLRHLSPVSGIPPESLVFYGPEDVVDPRGVVQRAIEQFNEQGLDGVIERHRWALREHHGTQRIQSMLRYVAAEFAWGTS